MISGDHAGGSGRDRGGLPGVSALHDGIGLRDGIGLHVSGGAGGVSVKTEDMVLAAARIEALATILAQCARAGDVIDSDLASAECWFADPAGHRAAQEAIDAALSGAGGARGLSCRFEFTASNLRSAARAYAEADHSGRAWFDRLGEALTGVTPEVIGTLIGRPELDTGPELAAQILAWMRLAGVLLENHPWYQDGGAGAAATPQGPFVAAAPASVAALLSELPASSSATPQVRIERIDTQRGRRWIVLIPGTADWPRKGGRNPFDGAGAIGVAALRRTAGVDAVEKAMEAVKIPPGEPVLIAGYSQGAMIGASVAVDPEIAGKYAITHLVTAGGPIGSAPIPSTVQVLSIEHTDDLIPKLDAARNSDRVNWTTVSRPALGPDDAPLSGHDLARYIQTGSAIDGSEDASIRTWKDGAQGFLGRPGTTATSWTVVVGRSG